MRGQRGGVEHQLDHHLGHRGGSHADAGVALARLQGDVLGDELAFAQHAADGAAVGLRAWSLLLLHGGERRLQDGREGGVVLALLAALRGLAAGRAGEGERDAERVVGGGLPGRLRGGLRGRLRLRLTLGLTLRLTVTGLPLRLTVTGLALRLTVTGLTLRLTVTALEVGAGLGLLITRFAAGRRDEEQAEHGERGEEGVALGHEQDLLARAPRGGRVCGGGLYMGTGDATLACSSRAR